MSYVPPLLSSLAQLRYPIIQAPMAGVATPALAAAVSNAGGLGSLGIGASSLDQAHAMIRQTQQLTHNPFNVNLFCHQPAQRDAHIESRWITYMSPLFVAYGAQPPQALIEPYPSFLANDALFTLLCQLRPAVVSFHFGIPPRDWINTFRALGIYTMATATNLDEAYAIARAGIHAVVAQGIEAGGHRGMFDPTTPDACQTTYDLVQQFAQHLTIPIVAAGGLMNGADIHQALTHGATATQLGTAFLLCPEAGTSASYRTLLRTIHTTTLTAGISGRTARGIRNRLVQYVTHSDAPQPPAYPVAYDLTKSLATQTTHTPDASACWAGTNVAQIREYPAAELLHILVTEWQHANT